MAMKISIKTTCEQGRLAVPRETRRMSRSMQLFLIQWRAVDCWPCVLQRIFFLHPTYELEYAALSLSSSGGPMDPWPRIFCRESFSCIREPLDCWPHIMHKVFFQHPGAVDCLPRHVPESFSCLDNFDQFGNLWGCLVVVALL